MLVVHTYQLIAVFHVNLINWLLLLFFQQRISGTWLRFFMADPFTSPNEQRQSIQHKTD